MLVPMTLAALYSISLDEALKVPGPGRSPRNPLATPMTIVPSVRALKSDRVNRLKLQDPAP